ncbi:MAG: hypothetical protein PHO27_05160 [Sulfuricurvum sp.]|nr:hypothetical protein [Sulfuricurvum sp.]
MSLYDPAKSLLDSLDPMKQMNEEMKRLLDPMYDINKSLGSMISVNDSIANAFAPMKAFNEQISALTIPYGAFDKTIGNMFEPMKKWNEQMETMLNPYKGFDKYFDAWKPVSSHWEELAKSCTFLDVIKPVSTHWEELTKSFTFLQDNFNLKELSSFQKQSELFASSISSYKAIGAAFSAGYIESIIPKNLNSIVSSIIEREAEYQKILESFSTIEQDDESAFLEELQVMKDEILTSINSNTARVEEQIEAIYLRIMSTENSIFRAFFMSFIFPIIIGLLTTVIYDYKLKPMLAAIENPKQQQIAIKKEVVRNVKFYLDDPQQRAKYRIVSTNVLNVRLSNSKASRTIAFTFFGEVVEIVRKERNWCLIRRYDPESETYIQGWVFTRYLGRIR